MATRKGTGDLRDWTVEETEAGTLTSVYIVRECPGEKEDRLLCATRSADATLARLTAEREAMNEEIRIAWLGLQGQWPKDRADYPQPKDPEAVALWTGRRDAKHEEIGRHRAATREAVASAAAGSEE